MKMSVFDCPLLELSRINDRAGNTTAIQNMQEIPFDIKRVFYLYDVPSGEIRGTHAHKNCHQFLVAPSGSFEVQLDDGIAQKTVIVNQPFRGLHIKPGIWASEFNFSSGAICLVLASHKYDESDYISDYEEFLKFKK